MRKTSLLLALGTLSLAMTQRADAQRGASPPDATSPPAVKSGLTLPDIPLHDPWMIADS